MKRETLSLHQSDWQHCRPLQRNNGGHFCKMQSNGKLLICTICCQVQRQKLLRIDFESNLVALECCWESNLVPPQPICGVSNVCYYCRIALAKEKPFEETDIGKKCLMALDDAHYGFDNVLDQYDYYYLSSYSKDKVDAYVDTDDLKKDDLKNEYDMVVKKLKALLALACQVRKCFLLMSMLLPQKCLHALHHDSRKSPSRWNMSRSM